MNAVDTNVLLYSVDRNEPAKHTLQNSYSRKGNMRNAQAIALLAICLGSSIFGQFQRGASTQEVSGKQGSKMPATAPAVGQAAVAQSQYDETVVVLAQAEKDASAAIALAGVKFDSLDQNKQIRAALADLMQKLNDARAHGTPQERLDASSAWGTVSTKLSEARAAAVAKDPSVIQTKKALAEAKTEHDQAQKSLADAIEAERIYRENNDPIELAIKSKQLAIGMTLEQANKAMGQSGYLMSESQGGQQYKWAVGQEAFAPNGSGALIEVTQYTYYFATFSDGKLAAFRKQ